MRNRLVIAICILSLAFTLVACGNGEDNHDTSVLNTETSTVESEISTQEETTSQETTEVVENEAESEATPATEENIESAPKDEPSEEPEQPAHAHEYTKAVTKEPTCRRKGEVGKAVYTCSCGDSYTEQIDCVTCEGDGVRVTIQEPDCQHCGISTEHCKWCQYDMYQKEIPMTEHVPLDDYVKAATCWALYCSDCGAVLDEISFDESPEKPQRTLE